MSPMTTMAAQELVHSRRSLARREYQFLKNRKQSQQAAYKEMNTTAQYETHHHAFESFRYANCWKFSIPH